MLLHSFTDCIVNILILWFGICRKCNVLIDAFQRIEILIETKRMCISNHNNISLLFVGGTLFDIMTS